jgi:hypothetical protein
MFVLLCLAVLCAAYRFATVRMALRDSAPSERAEILRALSELFRGGGGASR